MAVRTETSERILAANSLTASGRESSGRRDGRFGGGGRSSLPSRVYGSKCKGMQGANQENVRLQSSLLFVIAVPWSRCVK
jgi:hypothetical protein